MDARSKDKLFIVLQNSDHFLAHFGFWGTGLLWIRSNVDTFSGAFGCKFQTRVVTCRTWLWTCRGILNASNDFPPYSFVEVCLLKS